MRNKTFETEKKNSRRKQPLHGRIWFFEKALEGEIEILKYK